MYETRAFRRVTAWLVVLMALGALGGGLVIALAIRHQTNAIQAEIDSTVSQRREARCQDYQATVILHYIVAELSQDRPLPADVQAAIKLVPPANVQGVDCQSEVRKELQDLQQIGKGDRHA